MFYVQNIVAFIASLLVTPAKLSHPPFLRNFLNHHEINMNTTALMIPINPPTGGRVVASVNLPM